MESLLTNKRNFIFSTNSRSQVMLQKYFCRIPSDSNCDKRSICRFYRSDIQKPYLQGFLVRDAGCPVPSERKISFYYAPLSRARFFGLQSLYVLRKVSERTEVVVLRYSKASIRCHTEQALRFFPKQIKLAAVLHQVCPLCPL